MSRPRLKTKGGLYFSTPKKNLELVDSGCEVLNCVLGGGWVLGRIGNVVGDKSTGKTLLMIEACANFARQYPDGLISYREAEAAFDQDYAGALGLPIDRVDFGEQPIETIEDFFEDLEALLKRIGNKKRALYILDSLDALSDRAEMEREMDKGSYSLEKQKKLGQLFRRLVRKLEQSKVLVLIVSQVRDNIGVTFGKKHTRSGGKALDFYASQVIYLAHLKRLKRTVSKVERPVGIEVKVMCEKNKVGLPFRECVFPIKFAYGVDDVTANLNWLEEVGRLDEAGIKKTEIASTARDIEQLPPKDRLAMRVEIAQTVRRVWHEVERKFLPTTTKYGD